jgi:SNF2 family DNA or RNA helicase
VPHAPDASFLLRKLGYDVPSPILTHYDWCGGKPFEAQRQTAAMLTMNQRAYVLNGMGTGKTKAALWWWDYLRSNNLAGKLLVSAPLSTLEFVWAKEVFATVPHRRCVMLHGTRDRRLKLLADPDAEIFIVNHDGHKIIDEAVLARGDIDALVIDELRAFSNAASARSKAMAKFASKMKWVVGMTGSPIPGGPLDAYGQCRIVTPHTVPKYFSHFREQLCTRDGPYDWKPRDNAVEQVYKAMTPHVRYTLDDVVELPECVERTMDVGMGTQQAHIYKELKTKCFAAVQSQQITALNAGAVMMKLLQVACGWVYAKDGSIVALDNNERMKALLDAIESTDRKVLVFVPFKHALEGLCSALTKEKIDYVPMSGDTPPNKRAEIFNLFQGTTKYKVMPAHPACMSHGVTLTAAATTIWFTPILSLNTYEQANHRMRRVGQRHKQLLLKLQGTPVEKKIYSMLDGHQRVQDKLLELFADGTSRE